MSIVNRSGLFYLSFNRMWFSIKIMSSPSPMLIDYILT